MSLRSISSHESWWIVDEKRCPDPQATADRTPHLAPFGHRNLKGEGVPHLVSYNKFPDDQFIPDYCTTVKITLKRGI
jgi:hypothetical protein